MEKLSSKYRKNWDKKKLIVLLLGFLIFAIITFFISNTYSDITTSYSVFAETERIDIITDRSQDSKWQIHGATIQDDFGKVIEKEFYGTIDVFDSVHVTIERIGKLDFYIVLESLKNGPPITYSHSSDLIQKDTVNSGGSISIYLKDIVKKAERGITHVFPFSGYVTLGHNVDEKTYDKLTLLKSGIINMRGKNEIEDSYFLGDTEYLRLGDQLDFPKGSVSVGLLSIGEKSSIEVNFRTEAKEAYLKKPMMKGNSYKISVSKFDQWKNDKDYQRASMIIAILLVIFTLFTFIFDLNNFLNEK